MTTPTQAPTAPSTAQVVTHVWQDAGLGTAPFRCVALISIPSKALCEANPTAYNIAMADACAAGRRYGVDLCMCQYCGMSLTHNAVIKDAKGHHFVVGLDCAGRTSDAKLIGQAEALERKRQAEIRAAKKAARAAAAAAKRAERLAAQQAEEEAQRLRNGGQTDAELEVARREAEQAAARREVAAANGWVSDVLAAVPYASSFVAGIRADLDGGRPLAKLSPRALEIVAEIWSKQTSGSRAGTAKYLAALAEFNRLAALAGCAVEV